MTSKTLSKPHSDLVTSTAFDPASRVSLEESIRDFIRDYRAREAAKATLYRYEHYLNDYESWLLSEELPADMASLQGKRGVKHIQGYLAYMRRDKAAAPGTIATAFRVLKTFWNWAVRESLDEDNEPSIPPFVKRSPMDFLAKTETPRDVVADDVGEPFSDEEVSRILAEIGPTNSRSLEVLRNRAIVHTLLASGVRRKELTGLLISDYNPDRGHIMVRRSTAKQTRRSDDSRLTTLYGVAQKEVNNYVRRLRVEGKVNGPLFPSMRGGQTEHRGHHLRPDSVTQILDRVVKAIQAKCRLAHLHPEGEGCTECIRYGGVHRFRATWACNQLRQGASPSAVKELGGWSTFQMVERYSRKVRGEVAIAEIKRVNSR